MQLMIKNKKEMNDERVCVKSIRGNALAVSRVAISQCRVARAADVAQQVERPAFNRVVAFDPRHWC